LSLPVTKQFDVRLAFKYLEVKSELGGVIQQQVMIPKYRAFINLAYKTRNKRWEFDYTTSVYGKSRLHVVELPDHSMSTENESNVFPIINAQITHIFRKWDFYLGGENIGNYKQKNPIIDTNNPFGTHFDATRVWAPIQGINVYIGLRYKLANLKQEKK
jgi:hypothetical protein